MHNGVLSIYKNKIMSFAGKWVKVEIFKLSEISQIQKDKYCIFTLIHKTYTSLGRERGPG
jgi:hypothetical protein